MKILVYGINYSPELTGIGKYTGEMVEWLAAQGHEVRVITAPPYYPQWQVGENYSAWRYKREEGAATASFDHIDNNHEGLSKEQIVDLMHVNDEVEAIFDKINDMLASNDFSDLDLVLEMRDRLFDTIVGAIKNQLRRINSDPSGSTRASVLYLTILNETKTMVLQARNLLKSQHYFLEQKK